MTASFPTSIKSFTAVTDGVGYPKAADINSLQEEVTAIETLVGSAASNISIYNVTTTGVSTSATTILARPTAAVVNFVVMGFDSGFTKYFMDTVVAVTGGAFTVLHATNIAGSPDARTYSWSGNNVQLAMAAGTYTTRVSSLIFL